jgi:thiamine-monophosphate kinase
MTNFLDAPPASDEPTRLRRFVAKMFAAPAALRVAVSETASAQLLEGADAQDDCAVFRLDGSQELVVGSDYVRGPKFRMYKFGLLNEYDLGYYVAVLK